MKYRITWVIVLILLFVFWVSVGIMLIHAKEADARTPWSTATATWYGPGFYNNRTACGQRYSKRIRGVAVPSSGRYHLRCGTKLTICSTRRCRWVRVIDTGRFRNHRFDLSARTSQDLCRCWSPYTIKVRWRYGWHHRQTNRA